LWAAKPQPKSQKLTYGNGPRWTAREIETEIFSQEDQKDRRASKAGHLWVRAAARLTACSLRAESAANYQTLLDLLTFL